MLAFMLSELLDRYMILIVITRTLVLLNSLQGHLWLGTVSLTPNLICFYPLGMHLQNGASKIVNLFLVYVI